MKVIRFSKANILSKQAPNLGELLDLLRIKRIFSDRVKKDANSVYCIIDSGMQDFFDKVFVELFGVSDEGYDAQYEADIYDDEKQAQLANIIMSMFNATQGVESLESLPIGKDYLQRVDDTIILYPHSYISSTILDIVVDESLLGFFVDDFEALFARAVEECLVGAHDFGKSFSDAVGGLG